MEEATMRAMRMMNEEEVQQDEAAAAATVGIVAPFQRSSRIVAHICAHYRHISHD